MNFYRLVAAGLALALLSSGSAAMAQTATVYGPVAGASGVALGVPGEVFAVQGTTGNVFRVAPGGGVTQVATGTGTTTRGIARDAAGTIYTARENGGIYRYDAGCVTPCAPVVLDVTSASPFQLELDAAGNLYASSYNFGEIRRYAAGCVAPCTPTIFATGLANPGGMSFDAAGNLYVSVNAGNLLRFAAGCATPCASTVYATGLGTGARGVSRGQGGTFFVANAITKQVYQVPSGGGAAVLFGSYPTMNFPLALKQDTDGRIFLADNSNLFVLALPVVTSVPTLSEWAMILFGLILAGSAVLVVQRRSLSV